MENPLIPKSDYIILRNLLRNKNIHDRFSLDRTIRKAAVLEDKFVTAYTVRLNSDVELYDLRLKTNQKVTIVMPHAADSDKERISVFAPLSVALLGHEKGDLVKTGTGRNERTVRIVNVSNHV